MNRSLKSSPNNVWSKLVSDKKSLITIIFGQCNDATRTKIAFLTRLRTICYKSDDGDLSYKSYKMVVTVKSLNNFSNSNTNNNPHTFKVELKIKFSAVSTITRRFSSGTGMLEHLLQAETPARDWDYYCGLGAPAQLAWEEKADALKKAMLLLLNSKNNNAKKDRRLAYSQGNKKA